MTRYATVFGVVLLAVVIAGAATGCASSRSVLYSGDSVGASGVRQVVSNPTASNDVQVQLARWVAEIERRGREDPSQRFRNLSARQFRQRLNAAAARYHFTVERVEWFRPREAAPLVIIQTSRYVALARAIPAIDRSINPDRRGNGATGWSYEAFFLEAQDERGVPFIAVSDALRGPNGWGGQWARSNQLYPFPHG